MAIGRKPRRKVARRTSRENVHHEVFARLSQRFALTLEGSSLRQGEGHGGGSGRMTAALTLEDIGR